MMHDQGIGILVTSYNHYPHNNRNSKNKLEAKDLKKKHFMNLIFTKFKPFFPSCDY
jgi:hypothetical protein